MNLSKTPNGQNTRWLRACLLLSAVLIVPFRLTYAQDVGAVERKLGEAVAEGHLSLEYAVAMMETLREIAEEEHGDDVEERIERWVGRVGEKIKRAVMEGEMSEEDAWRKWHQFKEHELEPKLTDAVAEGLVSEEWAWELREGIEMSEVGDRLKAAVAKGEMTEEEARAEWHQITRERKADASATRMRREVESLRREIAQRSPEENRREAEELMEELEEAKEEGDEDDVRMLSAELRLIKEALKRKAGDDRPEDQEHEEDDERM